MQLAVILTAIAVTTGAVIWTLIKHSGNNRSAAGTVTVTELTARAVEHIFDDQFREELRNRGRLHFENIIGENAMFLQQDLRLTTSQLNDYLKSEITRKLQEEFVKYEESITDAKQLAVESISKTQAAIEEHRQLLSQKLLAEIEKEKQQIMARFENSMATIVNHYVLAAIGDQIDLGDQLDFILTQLEDNKAALKRDLADGT